MKLAPSNFVMAGKALVATSQQNHGHGMEQFVTLGSIKDENAIEVFVEGNQIVNANMFYSVLDGHAHKTRDHLLFFTKHSEYSHHNFTVTAEGCIALDDDPLWVLGTNEEQSVVRFV